MCCRVSARFLQFLPGRNTFFQFFPFTWQKYLSAQHKLIHACLLYLLYKNPSPLNFTIPVWHYHTVDAVIHEPVKNTILETQPPIIIIAAQNVTENVIILNINLMTNNICDSTAQNETLNLKYSSQDELVKKNGQT